MTNPKEYVHDNLNVSFYDILSNMIKITKKPGCYLLVLRLKHRCRIKIGKLGFHFFDPGMYLYVGSAKNGIAGRIKRHFESRVKHWHIDYLKSKTGIIDVIEFPGHDVDECRIAQLLKSRFNSPVKGFGSSDCKCFSHLFFEVNPEEMRRKLAETRTRRKSKGNPKDTKI